MNNQSFKNFCRNYYLYRFLTDFVFLYAIHLLLFKMKGISVMEISSLLIIWSLTGIVLEIPTGMLSDRWNRKYVLMIGIIFKSAGFVLWYFADDFLLFALGFVCWGIEETLASGTQESLLFDTLQQEEKTEDYEKVAGKGNFYANLAIGSAVFIGAPLATFSFPLTIVLSFVIVLLAIIPITQFKDHRLSVTANNRLSIKHQLKVSFYEFRKSKSLRVLLVFTMTAVAMAGILDEYWQLYLDWIHLPLVLFGVAGLVVTGIESLGANYAYLYVKYFPGKNNIFILSLLASILLFLSIIKSSIFLLLPFMLFFLLIAIGEVIVEGRIQRTIESNHRATIFSMNSLMINLSGIAFYLLFGYLSKWYGLNWAFGVLAIVLFCYSVISLFSHRHRRKSINPPRV